jgi:hypothetical protein
MDRMEGRIAMQDAQQLPEPRPRYIGDSNAEMLALEWEGFEHGFAYDSAVEAAARTADQIVEAAGEACEQALAEYVFLSRDAFHTAYTHGWIAGCLAAQRGWLRR